MRRSRLAAIAGTVGLALAATGGSAAAAGQDTFYVSPQGSDANDGRSPAGPFATPERAEREIVARGSGTVYLMPGTYPRTTPLVLARGPSAQTWLAYRDGTAILDGGGKSYEAFRVQAANVTLKGLTIRNFVNNGIVVKDAPGVTISGNHLANIASVRWTQAAILVLGRSPHATVSGNDIRSTGYSGILLFAPAGGDLSGASITGNTLAGTCRTKNDCGAIYITGRTPTSAGSVIANNRISDFGQAPDSYGIYLDDFASKMKVFGNTIGGKGSNPIMIHGGHGNLVTHNTIALMPGHHAMLYVNAPGPRQTNMPGNRFEDNVVRGARGAADLVKVMAPGRQLPPSTKGNRF